MKTRVNLTVEKGVITYAKAYAQEHGTSVSEMVENYLQSLPKSGARKATMAELLASLPKPKKNWDGVDLKKEYWKGMEKKYGK